MAIVRTAGWGSPSANVSFAIDCFIQDSLGQNCGLRHLPDRAVEPYERIPGLRERLQDLQDPLLGNISGNAALEDLPLIRYLAPICLELRKHSLHIQQLISALEQSRSTANVELVLTSQHDIETAADVFFDCVSSLSDGELITLRERFQTAFSGSPNPYFKSSPLFYPEQYTLEDTFNNRFSVHAMIQSQEDERIQKLFITYAQARRGWRCIVVSAAF